MKVLLIDPGKRYLERSELVPKVYPHIGLAYMGTVLRERGFTVKMYDEGVESCPLNDILSQYDPDIVGISSMTFNILDAYRAASLTKEYSDALVVLGGAHPSALPETTMEECPQCDVIVRGEGEYVLSRIAEGESLSRIPGIVYRSPDITSTGDPPVIENLDELPFPDWSLFDYSRYCTIYSEKFAKRIHLHQVSGSRGCPYYCTFCYPLLGRTFRFRSPESIVDEIEYNVGKGAHHFDFTDSTTTIQESRFLKMCTLLRERGLHDKITWNFETRVDLVSESLLSSAVKAGSTMIFFGVESGDETILKSMKKNIDISMIEKAVKIATDAGLKVKVSFLIGHAYETERSAQNTFDVAERLRKKFGVDINLNLIDIYPGTDLYAMVEKGEGGATWIEGMRNNWAAYLRSTPQVEFQALSASRLEELFWQFKEKINGIPKEGFYESLEESS